MSIGHCFTEADQRHYHFMYFLVVNSREKIAIDIYYELKKPKKTCDQGIRPLIYGFYFIFILFEGPVDTRSDQFLPFVSG
jgi:hypothetical protein